MNTAFPRSVHEASQVLRLTKRARTLALLTTSHALFMLLFLFFHVLPQLNPNGLQIPTLCHRRSMNGERERRRACFRSCKHYCSLLILGWASWDSGSEKVHQKIAHNSFHENHKISYVALARQVSLFFFTL